MRKRMRGEEFVYGKTRKDTEFAEELLSQQSKKQYKEFDSNKFANNPRPKYEIFPGE